MKDQAWLLWENPDTGDIQVIEAETPIEKVNFGYFCHRWTGTKEQMEARKKQIIRQRICRFKPKRKSSLV
jgi:hypothetical protein